MNNQKKILTSKINNLMKISYKLGSNEQFLQKLVKYQYIHIQFFILLSKLEFTIGQQIILIEFCKNLFTIIQAILRASQLMEDIFIILLKKQQGKPQMEEHLIKIIESQERRPQKCILQIPCDSKQNLLVVYINQKQNQYGESYNTSSFLQCGLCVKIKMKKVTKFMLSEQAKASDVKTDRQLIDGKSKRQFQNRLLRNSNFI
ncbi:hypothetical protein pb186bvf_012129 [Paramecium bursaria]